MKRKAPAKPHTAPLSDASEPKAPSVQEQLDVAINALRAIQRQRIQEAAAIGRLLGDQ